MQANRSTVPDSSVHLINFRWLTALRWVAVIGQSLAIAFVGLVLQSQLPLARIGAVLLVEIATNLVASYRGKTLKELTERELAAWICMDLATFTSMLYLTGGPANPFSFFYIVHVAMASFTLRGKFTWSLVLLSTVTYGMLFRFHIPLAVGTDWNVHLYGVWVAYALVASCIVYFLQRARATIQEREQELLEQRNLHEQAQRLSSLATLAAGAAHELANPLGTIAVVSKELQIELSDGHHPSALADVVLVRGQVERCRKILTRMAHTAGVAPGESDQWIGIQALFHQAVVELPLRDRIVLRSAETDAELELNVPVEAVAQALRVLVDNALDVTVHPISLTAESKRAGLELVVVDDGHGIDEETLKRVFDPFFTTKPTGAGMGLGLYLARNVATGLGGALTLRSELGKGTRATLLIPSQRLRVRPTQQQA